MTNLTDQEGADNSTEHGVKAVELNILRRCPVFMCSAICTTYIAHKYLSVRFNLLFRLFPQLHHLQRGGLFVG